MGQLLLVKGNMVFNNVSVKEENRNKRKLKMKSTYKDILKSTYKSVSNMPPVQKAVFTYVNFKGINSVRTKKEYESDIREFFRIMRGKPEKHELETLVEKDLMININDVTQYTVLLKEEYKFANSSINRKIVVLRGLYKRLEALFNNEFIRSSAFNIGTLSHEAEAYDNISLEEADKMAELALNYSKPNARVTKFEEQYWLIKLTSRTSFRLKATLSLTWSDIENAIKHDDLYIISAKEKGGVIDRKPIVDNMYHDLLKLREVPYYKRKYNDDKVFHFRPNDVCEMIDELCKQMNFPKTRNVVFHSFRKCGGNYVMKITGNIYLAQKQYNHKSVITTEKDYVQHNRNYDVMAGALMDRKTDPNLINNLSQEQLRQIIANAPKEFQVQFELLAKKEVTE